jgi:hypothetical protein
VSERVQLVGPRATLLGRAQKYVGEVLFMLGARRLGWAVATFTIRGHTCATCGLRSHTERIHLLHECVQPFEPVEWPCR